MVKLIPMAIINTYLSCVVLLSNYYLKPYADFQIVWINSKSYYALHVNNAKRIIKHEYEPLPASNVVVDRFA